jgi:hypothetical protein
VSGSAKLDALTTVGGYLSVSGSAKLDAPLLTTVGGSLSVDGSAKLDAPLLTTVGGYLYVSGSAKLDALTTVGGYLSVSGSAKLDAPLLTTVGVYLNVYGSAKLPKDIKSNVAKASTICKRKLATSLKKRGLVLVDGILSWLISKKKLGTVVTMKVRMVGKLEVSYIVQRGDTFSHGKTIKEARDSLKYKISNRDTTRYKKWKMSDTKKLSEIIGAYRAITGACEFGVREFCEGKKLPKSMTIRKAVELTKGKYGNEQFAEFFR